MNRIVFLSRVQRSGTRFSGEALRCGRWFYPFVSDDREDERNYFEITPAVLSEMKSNYDAGVKGYEQLVNVEHDDNRHVGWTAGLSLGECSLNVVFDVLDEDAAAQADKGLLKYLSSEIDLAWTDPETGKTGPVFQGLALTRRPYVKRLKGVQRVVDLCEIQAERDDVLERKEEKDMTSVPSEGACNCGCKNALLSEEGEKHTNQGETPMDSTATLQERNAQLEAEVARLSEEKAKVERAGRQAAFELTLKELARGMRTTPPIYKALLSLGTTLIASGAHVVKLAKAQPITRVRLNEAGEAVEETVQVDHIDVLDEVTRMLQTLPDDMAGPPKGSHVEEECGMPGADLSERAERLRRANPDLSLEEAAIQAEKQGAAR